MDLPADFLPPSWLVLSFIGYIPVLIAAFRLAPWRKIRSNESLHVFLGVCVTVIVLWQIKAVLPGGFSLHLLGATIMTLMFEWQFAVIGMSIVLLVTSISGSAGWGSFGVNALLGCVLPVFCSYVVARAVHRFFPRNFFVYIFLSCFANGGVTMALTSITSVLFLLLASDSASDFLLRHYLTPSLLLVFPEAFISGMSLTLFVVYKPQWVSTFRDELYLKGK